MNVPRLALAIGILTGFATGAGPSVEIWSAGDMKQISLDLAPAAVSKGVEGKTLGAYGSHSAAIWRRAKSGEAELHRTKTDLLVIEEGEATLVFGGRIPNARVSAPNEVRGGSIEGGRSRKLMPGDIIRIPPDTPHQFILAPGQHVAYFALKIAR